MKNSNYPNKINVLASKERNLILIYMKNEYIHYVSERILM